ncbi:DUF563 domain-containing protein [Halorubrum sp. GN11GM_10-3_MGM]|uniref:glycosyltransferase family 61 protein n=1 Tax=Halorubrum sp. GN11GM_10-3_MGM TaxID=2518111 RepID=UPI00130527E2|nr:glycosyltransferase family 61 protein [Halorubrum sp. GN11GM_10-3_MGM]
MNHFSPITRNSKLLIGRNNIKSVSQRYYSVGNKESITPELAEGVGAVPEQIKNKQQRLESPSQFVCQLSNIKLFGEPPLFLDKYNRPVVEEFEGSTRLAYKSIIKNIRNGHILKYKFEDKNKIKEPVSAFCGFWSNGYYHWYVDYLPKIRALEVYYQQTNVFPKIILRNPTQWQIDSLEILGVPEEKLLITEKPKLIDKYVLPSLPRYVDRDKPAYGYVPSPSSILWVKNRIKSNLPNVSKGNREERILITRSNAAKRKILNIDELVKKTRTLGFKPYTLDELTIRQQIELFSHADIVVAPHGAGLTNTIFSEDTTVVEIVGDYFVPCYYVLSNILGHDYHYFRAEEVEQDISVNSNSLVKYINSLM